MRNSVIGNIVLFLVALPENFLGVVHDLMEKLAGKNGTEWFEALKKFLRKENPWAVTIREWKVWKTIKLGTGLKTMDQFLKAMEAYGYKVSDWAKDLLKRAKFLASVALKEIEADLVIVTVAELGFKDGATFKEICDKAIELGLLLCPAEVGPQLRLQYQNQPIGEWLYIAMEAITDSGQYLRLFVVERGSGGLYLGGDRGSPGLFYDGGYRFVFVRGNPARNA